MQIAPLAMLWVAASAALGAEASDWDVVATGAITIRARARAGTSIREVWAEGELAAPALKVQEVLLDPENFPHFMPYVKECRYIGQPEADGSRFIYTRLELPVVTSRDYVLKINTSQKLDEQGAGMFENSWVAVPDRLPHRHSIIRLRLNEGSWKVTQMDAAKTRVIYRFVVDPSGWLPAFAANQGNTSGVTDTFRAIEKEAQRRAALPAKDAGTL